MDTDVGTSQITTESNSTGTHLNVMEGLVYLEIDKQLRFYPSNLRKYLNLTEVATYALNRLPPLYASSVKGVEEQRRVAARKYRSEITSAVRRAIAAVERDPLRSSEPIVSEMELNYRGAETALQQIQELLRRYRLLDPPSKELTWDNCLPSLRQAFIKLTAPSPDKAPAKKIPPVDSVLPPPPPRLRTPDPDQVVDPRGTLW